MSSPKDGQKKAQQKVIKAGAKRGGRVEILDGLTEGETVALDGAGFLTNGAAVTVKEAKPDAQKAAGARRRHGAPRPPAKTEAK